jgi:hypothetical protein
MYKISGMKHFFSIKIKLENYKIERVQTEKNYNSHVNRLQDQGKSSSRVQL